MYYILVIISTVIFVLGIKVFSKDTFFTFVSHSAKQLNIILDSEVDENEKQQSIIENLKRLLFYFGKLLLIFLFILFISIIPVYVYVHFFAVEESAQDVTSFKFLGATALGSLVLLINPQNDESDYSYWSKLLHEMFLENHNLSKLLHKIERKFFFKNTNTKPYIVISGLARAGTTAGTKYLYKSGQFYSLSYANMPLLLAPNLWSKLYKPKDLTEKERAHGDRMNFSLESIEALDEFFFKSHLNNGYIKEKSLKIHEVKADLYQRYKDYQYLIDSKKQGHYYITKNNNFALRYESCRKLDSHFIYVIVIRDPLSHASSLLKQHLNFSKIQGEDDFTLKYMNWLGHFEFGMNHKGFDFNLKEVDKALSLDTLEYWLSVWFNYYTFVRRFVNDKNVVILSYDQLLNNPEQFKNKISKILCQELSIEKEKKFQKTSYNVDKQGLDKRMLSNAETLYLEFLSLQNKI